MGSVSVFGMTPHAAVARGLVAAVVQTGGLLKELRVRESVEYVAALFPDARPVDDVLTTAGVADLADRRLGKCSGGEQQRMRFRWRSCPTPRSSCSTSRRQVWTSTPAGPSGSHPCRRRAAGRSCSPPTTSKRPTRGPTAPSSRRAATPVSPSSCGRADHPRIDPNIDERPTMTIRLLIADDRAMVRGALAALLDLESDLEVVAEVGRGDEVLDACCEHAPSSCRRAPCATTCRLRSARRADAPAQTPSASRRRTGGCERDPLHTYRAVNLVVFGNVVS